MDAARPADAPPRAGEEYRVLAPPRTPFIVFEGMDRAGKSTQLKALADTMLAAGARVRTTGFPNEDYVSGRVCRDYIAGRVQLSREEAHELFARNRRDAEPQLRAWLAEGYTVLCDRYAYSGVAYSVAKGMAADEARRADAGLLAPDEVFVLVGDAEVLAKRAGYGADRHDDIDLQRRVGQEFAEMARRDTRLFLIDASGPPDEVAHTIRTRTLSLLTDRPESTQRGVVWRTPEPRSLKTLSLAIYDDYVLDEPVL